MPSVIAKTWSRGGTFLRYAAGSVVAFGCSEVVLVTAYGAAGTGARTAAILAWVAGAAPNYVLNRRWAWKKKGRAEFLRETLPYWAITLGTAALAVTATTLADGWVRRTVTGRGEQSILLGVVYLAAYGVVFAIKFVLFDKLVFAGRKTRTQPQAEPQTRRQAPSVGAPALTPSASAVTSTAVASAALSSPEPSATVR
jgi:putative flippase GtrA